MILQKNQLERMIVEAKRDIGDILSKFQRSNKEISDFHLATAYLIYQAFNQERNLFIGMDVKEFTSETYLPAICILVYELLQKNFEEYSPSFDYLSDNMILIDKGKSYTIGQENGKYYLNSYKGHGNRSKAFVRDPIRTLKTHFIGHKTYYSERICHKALDEYKEFFQTVFDTKDYPPSLFKYKAVVVCNKKDFQHELKRYGLEQCFSYTSLIRDKENISYCRSLPLYEPMIYFSSNYEDAFDYIENNIEGSKIDYVFLFGNTRVIQIKNRVKVDYRKGKFQRFCLIGNEPIKDKDIIIWNWTTEEEAFLNGKHTISFHYLPLKSNIIMEDAIDRFNCEMKAFYDEDDELWQQVKPFMKCFWSILSDRLYQSESFDKIESKVRDQVEKNLNSSLYDDLSIYKEQVENIIAVLSTIYNAKLLDTAYLEQAAENREFFSAIVVPNDEIDIWKENIVTYPLDNIHVITNRDFRKEIKNMSGGSNYLFTFPMYDQDIDIVKRNATRTPITISFLLYESEIVCLKRRVKYHQRNQEINASKNMEILPNNDFYNSIKKTSSDLISRLDENFDKEFYGLDDSRDYDMAIYKVEVKDYEKNIKIVSCPSRIIRIEDGEKYLVSIEDLKENDRIIIYHNKSRDVLYKILADTSEKYANIEHNSSLWRYRLKEYLEDDASGEQWKDVRYNPDKLKKISSIINVPHQYILDSWLTKGAVKFPNKKSLLSLLDILIDEGYLKKTEKDELLKSRRFYLSVMISLGHNLSGEVQRILVEHNKEDDFSQHIATNVVNNKSQYPLLSDFDASEIFKIIIENIVGYTFIKISDKEAIDEEI